MTRDHRLVIRATGAVPRLDLFANDGKHLATDIDPAQLGRYAPELADAYRRGIAGRLDARVDREVLRTGRRSTSHKLTARELSGPPPDLRR